MDRKAPAPKTEPGLVNVFVNKDEGSSTSSRQRTFAQLQAYQEFLDGANNAVNLAFLSIHDGVNLVSPTKVKPSYISVLKQGKISLSPPKQSAPSKHIMLDKNKLYLDCAATYHSMFCKWCLTNVRLAGKVLYGTCNDGVMSTLTKGQLGML